MNPTVIARSRITGVQRAVLVLGSVLLVVAISLQLFFRWREKPHSTPPLLADVMVRSLKGWRVTDEQLGQTEAVSSSVLKTLNFDDYVYRRYQSSGAQFTVYVAYWGPGKMPTRLVASHTPDRCWTESGMRCVEMRFRERFELGGKTLLPAEVRAFLLPPGGEKTYVAYWHLVDGRLYDYGARFNAVPHPWLWWKDAVAQAAYGSREQLFIRITSLQTLEILWRDPGFQRVMEGVAALGLYDAGPDRRE